MLARAGAVALVGLDGHPVDVEVSILNGLPGFTIVGLPDVSVQEARERVRAAIQNSNETWPLQRITVNLSPTHLRKAGAGFDLAIAVGILAASGRVAEERLRDLCLVGALSLDGSVRPIRGALAAALAARQAGSRGVMVPIENAAEASLVQGVDVLPVRDLAQTIRFLQGRSQLDACPHVASPEKVTDGPDLVEVRGQTTPKKALEIAAAGGHNLLMMGTPGGGKTMLARRLPSILPPLGDDEALEVTRIYSVAGLTDAHTGLIRTRPFRAPHHSVSTAGLVGGGGGLPSPGEVSLAHRGVLFLDEATEFRRDALQALRGPIEDGVITLTRARFTVTYPARFQLVIAANPCPCGYFGDERTACECLPGRLSAYKERLSGPLLDRVDLQVSVPRLGRGEIFRRMPSESSDVVRERVEAARRTQAIRLGSFGLVCNAEVPPRLFEHVFGATTGALAELERLVDHHGLSGRGAHRLLRVSRTIADLEGKASITSDHVVDAMMYRVG